MKRAVGLKQGVAVGVSALAAYIALRMLRARVYDALIVRLTTEWYSEVLKRLPLDCELLDVGIGTGTALANNEDPVRTKNIRVDGVDDDGDYIRRCRAIMMQRGLD
ncbi:TPA: hypothetical protein N0F65_001551 [Lagenidium giganteum]|uniref:Methyltransferase domain-containing protein n=1 Tax=Lagenidium giganteum TaxID=4803 RepID=A0AAV2YII6_9STRA|nr:TPA: hypothetical protein N0F65_001551 [Lagenidium giganteum]